MFAILFKLGGIYSTFVCACVCMNSVSACFPYIVSADALVCIRHCQYCHLCLYITLLILVPVCTHCHC